MFLCFRYLSYGPLEASRMCAVAQYAVLEANGTGQISPSPHPSETLIQFRCLANYITMSPRESMCKIWLESIRPLQICACVKKHVFVWIFFYLRLYVLCLWLVRPSVHAFVCVCVCVGMMVEALSNWLQKRLNLSRADFATDWPGVPRRPCCNNNNSNSHDNVYGAVIMTKVIARVHLVHLMNVDWAPGGHQPSDQASRLGMWVRQIQMDFFIYI